MASAIKAAVLTQAEGAHLADYFAALASCDDVQSVAVGDASGDSEPIARRTLGEKLGATSKDPAVLLREFQPQLVIVSMESDRAPAVIDAALEAGCHVVAEKPSCTDAREMEQLTRKAHSKHRHLMLAMPNRLHAPVREARRVIAEGKLGKLYGLEAHLVADQTRLADPAYRQSWLAHRSRLGGGVLAWLGILWLDTALYIAGEQAQQVTGFVGLVGGQPVDIEDSAALALRLAGGSLGTMTAGYYLDSGYQSHIQIWGEHGWLRLAAVEEQPLEWYSTKGAKPARVQRFEYAKGGRGFKSFIHAAARAATDMSVPPPITTDETLQIIKSIFAFYEAAKTGRTQ
jgi:predicted dehydrogenase